VKYPWEAAIYAVTYWGTSADSWTFHTLTFVEWGYVGYPPPRTAGWIAGSWYYRWSTSDELFVRGPNGVLHKLTFAEWTAAGAHGSFTNRPEGFAKLSWDPGIAKMTNMAAGIGTPIDYATWAAEQFPTPVSVLRFPGDKLYMYASSPSIYYAGPTTNRVIPYAEWGLLGYPATTILS
jgi:hypothetical protein